MRLTLNQITEIKRLRNQNVKRKDIASELGITENQVKYILDQSQFKTDNRKMTTIEIEIKNLYIQGWSRSKIADKIGWKVDRVKTFLYRNKISRNRIVTEEQKEKIMDLWSEKYSQGEIAIKLRLTKGVVWYQLRKMCLVG